MTSGSTTRKFEIVIVGGGLVGACMARLLVRVAGNAPGSVLLLEARLPSRPPEGDEVDLRVSAISRATERILTRCNAWTAIDSRYLSPYERMCVWDEAGRFDGQGAITFDCAELGEPNLGYIVENRRLQWALLEQARAGGVCVESGAPRAVSADASGVSV